MKQILNYKKLSKKFTEELNKFSSEDLQNWIDFDKSRIKKINSHGGNMKKILTLLTLILSINAYSQTAKPDTIYYKYNSIAFKPDTINFKLLSNDLGTNIKIIEFSINCVRYTSLSTFKTIANFGKIKLASTGIGTFISTKYTSSPIITSFVYTINDGKCGTSQTKVTICDSAYYYASSNYAWTKSPNYGWGYFTMANGLYIIQYKGFSEFVSEEAYIQAYKNK